MKKNLLKSVFVIAIAMIAGINVYNAQKTVVLSDVAMANVEALADYEWIPGKGWTCFHNVYDDTSISVFLTVRYCGDCNSYTATKASDSDYCTYTGMYD